MNTTNTITFQTTDTTWVMRITADRRIEVNTDVDVTEAAQKVLDAMQHLLTQQRTTAEGEDTRRAWVGLTDDEKQQCIYDKQGFVLDYEDVVDAVEDKLKEKNT
jgi:predicted RNA binding protein with dsRBD fold (UPF0201 family)